MAAPSSLSSEAEVLNDYGARLLMEGGDLHQILLSFGKCFTLLEQEQQSGSNESLLRQLQAATEGMVVDASASASPSGVATTNGTSSKRPLACGATACADTSYDSFWDPNVGAPLLSMEQLFVYHKPIRFSATDDSPLFWRAALQFNVSLATHCLALRTGDLATFHNAILLYDLAHQTFQTLLLVTATPSNNAAVHAAYVERIQVYLLAAWNNQATIHLTTKNRDYARDMFNAQQAMVLEIHQRQTQDQASKEKVSQVSAMLKAFLMNEVVVEVGSLSASMA